MVAFHLLAAALIATAAAAAAEPADLAAATAAAAAGAEPLATCAAAAFLNNTDFHDGQGLGHAPGKDAADCCTQCASSAWAAKGCKFFTLSVISGVGTCWFKKDDSGRRYIAGAISGGVSGAPLGPAPPAPPTALCPDPSKINIACVGDSITFGAHSSGGQNYPAQLQGMLDKKYPGKYCAVKLGTCGATMQRPPYGDAPYWKTREFATWTTPANAKLWDKIVIMLGTNDAKDACPAEHCPASAGCANASFCQSGTPGSCCNWPHAGQTNWTQDCTDLDCPFAKTYAEMITLARTMGRKQQSAAGPEIFVAIPPPLMNGGSPGSPAKPYGMNQTVINDILPAVMPKIAAANKLPKPIDVFSAMGGTSGLECGYRANNNSAFLCDHKCTATCKGNAACGLQCDSQSCDPCHPNNAGYTVLAATVMKGLGL